MIKQAQSAEAGIMVREHEGAVLSLIARTQPVTRYRLARAFEQSPTTSKNASKGTIYPLISRMVERGLVQSTNSSDRGGEEFSLTPAGRKALHHWLLDTGPEQSFSHDPLLERIMSLSGVSQAERIRWIAEAKSALLAKKAELEEYRKTIEGPYTDIAHGFAVATLDAKLEWLDRLLIEIVRET